MGGKVRVAGQGGRKVGGAEQGGREGKSGWARWEGR